MLDSVNSSTNDSSFTNDKANSASNNCASNNVTLPIRIHKLIANVFTLLLNKHGQ